MDSPSITSTTAEEEVIINVPTVDSLEFRLYHEVISELESSFSGRIDQDYEVFEGNGLLLSDEEEDIYASRQRPRLYSPPNYQAPVFDDSFSEESAIDSDSEYDFIPMDDTDPIVVRERDLHGSYNMAMGDSIVVTRLLNPITTDANENLASEPNSMEDLQSLPERDG